MIRMDSPSFAFNSVDVPGPNYRMWESFTGTQGLTATMLVAKIATVNRLAWEYERSPLKNIVINSHGLDGGGRIFIGGDGEIGISMYSVDAFLPLKGKNLGTIWLVACQAAAGEKGKELCRAIAVNSGSQVVAADEDQDTGIWGSWRLVSSLNNIDEFEGTVYAFTPDGGTRVINPHDDIFTILE